MFWKKDLEKIAIEAEIEKLNNRIEKIEVSIGELLRSVTHIYTNCSNYINKEVDKKVDNVLAYKNKTIYTISGQLNKDGTINIPDNATINMITLENKIGYKWEITHRRHIFRPTSHPVIPLVYDDLPYFYESFRNTISIYKLSPDLAAFNYKVYFYYENENKPME